MQNRDRMFLAPSLYSANLLSRDRSILFYLQRQCEKHWYVSRLPARVRVFREEPDHCISRMSRGDSRLGCPGGGSPPAPFAKWVAFGPRTLPVTSPRPKYKWRGPKGQSRRITL